MKINFFAGENKFIYGKKFSGIREKILRHTGRNKFSCGRKFHGSQYSLIVMRFTINLMWFTIDWPPQSNFIGPAYRDESSCISCIFPVMLRRAWFQLFSGNRPGFQDFLCKFATQFH